MHLLVYVVINGLLTLGWATGARGLFWPIFLMVVWGTGVGINGYLAYRPAAGRGL